MRGRIYLKFVLDGKLHEPYEYVTVVQFRYFLLSVSYSDLLQFSLRTAHDSLRRSIAKMAAVSPLRVVDIHVSSVFDMIFR